MKLLLLRLRLAAVFALFVFSLSIAAGESEAPALVGRWDLKVRDGANEYPSWLEVRISGFRTLVGSYVGQFGSVRPIGKIDFDKNSGQFHFTVPPQWERRTNDILVQGKLDGDVLKGDVTNDRGTQVPWDGRRAPSLVRNEPPKWGTPIPLISGKDLSGWTPRNPNGKKGWKIENGILINAVPGNDLRTERRFNDFKLRAEFRVPKGSNSGIYLRGRYEVQIEDDFGLPPDSHYIGGVYGFLTPRVNAAKKPGEWQTLDITLVGRVVTIALNGELIIERQAIPGITGGALDSDEDKPGPILIQGDHGPVEFKDLTITPAE
jgi:hypothetical protein